MSEVAEPATKPAFEQQFGGMLGAVVALGAAVRLTYVLTDHRKLIGGDGYDYHLSALRLADGLGYTVAFGDLGAPTAHHPPGWVTFLGAVSWLGARSQEDHQLATVAVGLVVVALTGLVGRRYFNARVGLVAALIAAVYPGFWVLEGNMLSEPLALAFLGCFLLVVADLRDRPTLARSVLLGVISGLLALTRSEELALLILVVAPVLVLAGAVSMRRRIAYFAVVLMSCGAVIMPWTLYNTTRFEEPFLLSTNDGASLLAGNCAPATYAGVKLGWYDTTCALRIAQQHRTLDRSQLDSLDRDQAIRNTMDHVGRMLVVVPARFGRLLAVFRPSQTVGWVAVWMTTSTGLIWAWVASFWLILVLGIVGAIRARRSGVFILPLLGPVIAAIAVTAIGNIDHLRYHTLADLGIIVLAAAAIDSWSARPTRPSPRGEPVDTAALDGRSTVGARQAGTSDPGVPGRVGDRSTDPRERFAKPAEVVQPDLKRLVPLEIQAGRDEQRLHLRDLEPFSAGDGLIDADREAPPGWRQEVMT